MGLFWFTDEIRFRPTNYSGLQLWLDATRTPIGAVASWTDYSGNGNNCTQGTGAKQPVCTANQQNGKNTLVFTAASVQTLVMPSGVFSVVNGNNTIFCVAKRNTETVGVFMNPIVMSEGGNTATEARYYITLGGTSPAAGRFRSGTALNTGVLSSTFTTTNYNILTCFRLGTTQSISINNGTAVTDSNGASDAAIDRGYIGSIGDTTNYLNGGIAEMIIYNRALSAAEIVQVNRYLSNKWGITIS